MRFIRGLLYGLVLSGLFWLTGCVGDQGARFHAFAAVPAAAGTPASATPPAASPGLSDLVGLAGELRAETQASQNATQQSLSGLGLQLGKLAEKLVGVEASVTARMENNFQAMAKFEASLQTQLEAKVLAEVQASVKAQVQAQADVRAQVEASVQALADLRAELQALGAAQIGLKNEIQQTTQTVSAARDANVQTVQFTKEMGSVIEASYREHGNVVYVFCGVFVTVVGILQERSRARADARSREVLQVIREVRRGQA